jgi:ABC-2 type transport system ATP-binding protein
VVVDEVVTVDAVVKRFGDVLAVDHLSFSVPRGEVCGLLGPNGAGKTTVLRMLTGLEHPSSGRTRLFGTVVGPGCPELLRVGALVEQAAFVPHLTGMANLKLWWRANGARWADADLDRALAVAGLGDAVGRRVQTYSQGMKQRLGFARLLLGRPELLILDEPTNGLDPGEIRAIRELLRRMASDGATVLLSSHHLSEVEQTCDHVVVMDRGHLVADGTVDALIGSTGSVYLEVDDRRRAAELLAARPDVLRVVDQGRGLVVEQGPSGRRADLAAAVVGAGLRLDTISPTGRLEDAFLHLLGADDLDGGPR